MNYAAILTRPGSFVWAICECCRGNGTVDNPAFSNGFTSDEWHEACHEDIDDDGESFASRYLGGAYDVRCPECKGTGKVKAPDVERLTLRERRQIAVAERRDYYRHQVNAEAAAERRMGA